MLEEVPFFAPGATTLRGAIKIKIKIKKIRS